MQPASRVELNHRHQTQVLFCTRRNLFEPCNNMSELLDAIPDVDIDDNGTFKYILIHVFDADKDNVKTILRGYLREFHAHIYEEVEEKILKDTAPRLETECIGGGFIQHNAAEKKIKVYGRSMGFGKADHNVSVQLLKKAYPDYQVITTNEE